MTGSRVIGGNSVSTAQQVRESLEHPVIDADGHLVEYLPLVKEFLREEAGSELVRDFESSTGLLPPEIPDSIQSRRHAGFYRGAWWGLPAENSLDRATAALPRLMYDRLDELGIDLAFLYPTYGLSVLAMAQDDLRVAMARAFNRYVAEVYGGFVDRLCPVAVIPMNSPDEALAELDHAVEELGLRAVMMAGLVNRSTQNDEGDCCIQTFDSLGHDSVFDYDPVWTRCVELGVSPAFHSFGYGWGSRRSTRNYMYNHVGNFAAAGEATARSLFFGGVPTRFPELNWAFQEGGVVWALNLLSDIVGHYGKRNEAGLRNYEPDRLDVQHVRELFDKYGEQSQIRHIGELEKFLNAVGIRDDELCPTGDEFLESGIKSVEDIYEIFCSRYFFGCESDDPLNVLATRCSTLLDGAEMKSMFASDIGHWDVTDMRSVLPDAWDLVQEGLLVPEEFSAFVFGNVVDFYGRVNPEVFEGTSVEDQARSYLSTSGGSSPVAGDGEPKGP